MMIGFFILWSAIMYHAGRGDRSLDRDEIYNRGYNVGLTDGHSQVKEVLEAQLPIMLKAANHNAAVFIKKATPTKQHDGTFHMVLEFANPTSMIKYMKDKC